LFTLPVCVTHTRTRITGCTFILYAFGVTRFNLAYGLHVFATYRVCNAASACTVLLHTFTPLRRTLAVTLPRAAHTFTHLLHTRYACPHSLRLRTRVALPDHPACTHLLPGSLVCPVTTTRCRTLRCHTSALRLILPGSRAPVCHARITVYNLHHVRTLPYAAHTYASGPLRYVTTHVILCLRILPALRLHLRVTAHAYTRLPADHFTLAIVVVWRLRTPLCDAFIYTLYAAHAIIITLRLHAHAYRALRTRCDHRTRFSHFAA